MEASAAEANSLRSSIKSTRSNTIAALHAPTGRSVSTACNGSPSQVPFRKFLSFCASGRRSDKEPAQEPGPGQREKTCIGASSRAKPGDDFRLFSSLAIPVGQGLSGWVADNRKSIINGNPSVEPAYLNDPTKFSILRSALAVPLNGLNGVVGVLTLYRADKDAFSKDNLRVLLALSSKVSLAIENALKYRQAESCATTDYLTGLPNARSLFLHLDAELSRSKRAENPLAVLVCDLDGFKQINDRFGHLEGNRLLQMVANSFKEHCREYDYVARMGGDEFVLVIPGLAREKVIERIAQLENAVRLAGKGVCGEPIVSLSVGAAMYPDDSSDAEGLLSEADHRMYAAKQEHHKKVPPVIEIDAPKSVQTRWMSASIQ